QSLELSSEVRLQRLPQQAHPPGKVPLEACLHFVETGFQTLRQAAGGAPVAADQERRLRSTRQARAVRRPAIRFAESLRRSWQERTERRHAGAFRARAGTPEGSGRRLAIAMLKRIIPRLFLR